MSLTRNVINFQDLDVQLIGNMAFKCLNALINMNDWFFQTGIKPAISDALKTGINNIKNEDLKFDIPLNVSGKNLTIEGSVNGTKLDFVDGNAIIET